MPRIGLRLISRGDTSGRLGNSAAQPLAGPWHLAVFPATLAPWGPNRNGMLVTSSSRRQAFCSGQSPMPCPVRRWANASLERHWPQACTKCGAGRMSKCRSLLSSTRIREGTRTAEIGLRRSVPSKWATLCDHPSARACCFPTPRECWRAFASVCQVATANVHAHVYL